jgi:hypothetical protein
MDDSTHPPNPGGPDGATIDPEFLSVFDHKASSTGFINLARYNLTAVPMPVLLEDLASNPADHHPIFVDKVRQRLKLTFQNEAARDRAIDFKFSIQSQRVQMEIPLAERKDKTIVISLHGIPLSETVEAVQTWVATNYTVIGGPRFVKWPGSPFYKPGRAVTISLPKGDSVQGFQNYTSSTCKSIQIQVWHPGQRQWCKKCAKCGHHSGACPMKIVPSAQKGTPLVSVGERADKSTIPTPNIVSNLLPAAPDVQTGQSDLISPTTADNSDPPTELDPIDNLLWSHALEPSQNIASTSATGLGIRNMPEKRGRQENDPDSCDSGLEQRGKDDEEGSFTPVMGKKKKKITQGDGARGNCPSYCHCYRCENDL